MLGATTEGVRGGASCRMVRGDQRCKFGSMAASPSARAAASKSASAATKVGPGNAAVSRAVFAASAVASYTAS
jgi:hypothetical protein